MSSKAREWQVSEYTYTDWDLFLCTMPFGEEDEKNVWPTTDNPFLKVRGPLDRHYWNLKRPRIVVLGIRGFPNVQGGVEKHCQELYPRLAEAHFHITVLARKRYVKSRFADFKGVRIVSLWAPRSKHFETIFHTALGILWIARRRRNFEILHLHAVGPSLLAYAARKLRLRLVITHHGPDYDRQKWGSLAKKILRLGEFLGARYAYMLIAVSRHIQRTLLEKYNSVAVYIPNGVNPGKIYPPGNALKAHGLRKGKYFLAVGRLVPEKGFHVLLRAYSTLNTDWVLVIAGEADHEDGYSIGLKNEAARTKGVVMTGFQTGRTLAELYSNAGLFVLPSFHEGLPLVALEAMSYHLPILLSDIPANRELVAEGDLFPAGNAEALANRMGAFCSDLIRSDSPESIRKKGEGLETEFSWDQVAKETAEVYEAVAKMPGKMGVRITRRSG